MPLSAHAATTTPSWRGSARPSFAQNEQRRLTRLLHAAAGEAAKERSKLAALRQEVTAFLEEYYQRFGKALAEIEALKHALAQAGRVETANGGTPGGEALPAGAPPPGEDPERLKITFRAVAKRCHPDSPLGDAPRFRAAHDAYKSGNLEYLLALDAVLEIETALALKMEEILDSLQKAYEDMLALVTEYRSRRQALEASPACRLMRRALEAKLTGKEDLMARIARGLAGEAETLRARTRPIFAANTL